MPAPDLAQLITSQRDHIVSRFVAEVQRKDLAPPGVPRALLIDHIPKFLDEVVVELKRPSDSRVSQDAVETSATARDHGEQRWNLGYGLEPLIREYGVLRHCIIEAAKEAGASVSLDEFDVFSRCLSVGVAQAAAEYARVRDEELNAKKADLEFLAEAGQLLSSSLDYRSTLGRLTGLLVPRFADWCAIHVDGVPDKEMPIAHVDAQKCEILRDLFKRFPRSRPSPHGQLQVVATGIPQLVNNISPSSYEDLAESAEHLALVRAINTCSFIVVPLSVQQNTFGAMTLAYSDSGRQHEQSDLVVAGELAQRAAVAIDNARLYNQSQNERSRVEAATRAKDEFVAMVSHELRTPLNAILGWLALMRTGALPESKKDHAFDVIERNAKAQNQLVADLLDISKVITGKIRITPSQVDLANIVEMVIEGVRPAADAKRISIETDLGGDAVMRGDGDRLQQVVWNLVANAVKFTRKNGKVAVRVRRVDSDLELVVEDDGEGISPAFLPHVFDSFRQSDNSAARPHGGLGIGLSIVKHLVELHGGSIEPRSQGKDRGATFVVRLPISSLVSTTLGVARIAATKPPSVNFVLRAGLDGLRVLVVDDDPDARDLVGYFLETCGIEARAAGSASEALQELEVFTPHVLVSDIGMPGEDGYALIRSVRTLPAEEKRSIPAIALTAFASNEDRTRALVAGFNVHLVKPVEPAALVSAVVDLTGHLISVSNR